MSTTITQLQTSTIPAISTLKSPIQVEEQEISSPRADIPLPPPSKEPSNVLNIDQGTPDSHVKRDPRLIRLTGVHPFNVEAPLTPLFHEGMLLLPYSFPPAKPSQASSHRLSYSTSGIMDQSLRFEMRISRVGKSALKGLSLPISLDLDEC